MFRFLHAARLSAGNVARYGGPRRALSTSSASFAKAPGGSTIGGKSPKGPTESRGQQRPVSKTETIKQKVKSFVSEQMSSGKDMGQSSSSKSRAKSPSSSASGARSGSPKPVAKNVGKPAAGKAACSSVRMDKKGSRFTLDLGDGLTARIEFKQLGPNRIELRRIEVPAKLRGKGIGQALAKGALEEAAKNKLRVRISDDYLIKNLDKYANAKLKSIIDK